MRLIELVHALIGLPRPLSYAVDYLSLWNALQRIGY